MKRITLAFVVVALFLATLAPVSAASNTVEQSALPVPLGFCIQITMPLADDLLFLNFLSVTWYTISPYVADGSIGLVDEDMLNIIAFIPTGETWYFDTFDFDTASIVAAIFFDGLGANSDAFGGASVQIIPPNACSFRAYTDNAALAQTYMVPQKGYDVYQIFDGKGILSFTVSIEALESASAGAVLGSNDAGNIYFTYVGGSLCSVTYPYPDGKMNTSTFVCKK